MNAPPTIAQQLADLPRLVLNVRLSFVQFEREIVSERTRDKIAATQRKGKWAGGWPVLGHDVDPAGFKLRVNDAEADRVAERAAVRAGVTALRDRALPPNAQGGAAGQLPAAARR